MRHWLKLVSAAALSLLALSVPARAAAERDLFAEAPNYFGAGLGYIHYEGNELVNPGAFLSLKLGHDFNAWFSIELGMDYMPTLDETEPTPERPQPLEDNTWAIAGSLDVLAHLRNMEDLKWDPYLSAGGYLIYYGDELGEDRPELALNVGAGLFYHFSDLWSVRGDFRTAIAGADTEFNQLFTVGVNYRWGAAVKPVYSVSGGDIDSDNDGLLDKEETTIGTNPFDPDTDKDGLSDGQEVKEYKTEPLQEDTDLDALKDGAEVLTHKTNPKDQDTDDGGVMDGHEVLEDGTDPLNKADDLMLITLNIEFDYDKADLRQQYEADLNKVITVLERDPGATARIEGHADKRKGSKAAYNQRLSERRAKAVLDYIATKGNIAASRLSHKGFGFDRPIVPNDSEANMQKNRRTDIYIRRSGATGEVSPTQGAIQGVK